MSSTFSLFCGSKCNVHSLMSITGATAANLSTTSNLHVSADVGISWGSNGKSPMQKMNKMLKMFKSCIFALSEFFYDKKRGSLDDSEKCTGGLSPVLVAKTAKGYH